MMNRKAFTLIEVVLAMTIMVSGLSILANSWNGTYTRLKRTQIQVQLAALLERKIVDIEKEYKGKPLDSIPEEKEDTFGSELPEYSWKMTSQELQLPDISPLLEAQSEATGDIGTDMNLTTIMKMFTEHIGKSIKEVKIAVTYNDSKKPITADVVIYMIDYDKSLPLPTMGGGS